MITRVKLFPEVKCFDRALLISGRVKISAVELESSSRLFLALFYYSIESESECRKQQHMIKWFWSSFESLPTLWKYLAGFDIVMTFRMLVYFADSRSRCCWSRQRCWHSYLRHSSSVHQGIGRPNGRQDQGISYWTLLDQGLWRRWGWRHRVDFTYHHQTS